MTPLDALYERYRERETPAKCISCKRSYNDVLEGWNCEKYDAVVTIAPGKTVTWSGQSCDRAYQNDCRGNGYERSILKQFFRWVIG